MAVLDNSQSQLILNDLAGKSGYFIILNNITLNVVIFTVSSPNDQNISVAISDPSFSTINFILSSVYFINSCFKVWCIGAYLVLSQPPPAHKLEIF